MTKLTRTINSNILAGKRPGALTTTFFTKHGRKGNLDILYIYIICISSKFHHTLIVKASIPYTVKTFGLLQPLFQLPQLHVCGVCIMKFKEWFQSSKDLEIKPLRSFFFNNQSSFQKTNQLPFLEKAWLHSYGRSASNVHVAKIGLLKDKIMKKLLDGIQETYFRSIPGTSDNDTTLVQLR